jgi:hypothetical protein
LRFWERKRKKNFVEEVIVREKRRVLSRYGVGRGDEREDGKTCETDDQWK